MKVFQNLVIFISFSALALILFAWYSGFFVNIKIEIKEYGPVVMAYEDHHGAYSETSQIQKKLYNQLWDNGIENYKAFGIYYDDPNFVEVKNLHSRIGCVIEKDYVNKIHQLSDRFNIMTIKNQKCAIIKFPYRNTFSMYAGVYKAYPKLKDYCLNNQYKINPIIEIHYIPHYLLFIMPLANE
nr:GyrI-like domain-containing protein [Bacteroidota bacterium]